MGEPIRMSSDSTYGGRFLPLLAERRGLAGSPVGVRGDSLPSELPRWPRTLPPRSSLRLRRLTVNTPVGPYLPADWTRGSGFRATDAEKVTFGQLLTHMSGLRPDVDLADFWTGYDTAITLAIEEVPTSPPVGRRRRPPTAATTSAAPASTRTFPTSC